MDKKINLTVATDIEGMGGIASVLKTYQQAGFLDRWNIKLIASHSTDNRWQTYLLFLTALFKVCINMLFKPVGLVHVHMSSRGSYLRKSIIIKLVKLLKGKVILHLHSGEFDQFYEKECSTKKQEQIRALFASCERVIVLAKTRLVWLQSILSSSEHLRVIYNCVDQQHLSRENKQASTVAFLGKVCDLKGIKDLINAFKLVLESEPKAMLYLAGDGEIGTYQKLAEDLGIEESIEFLGWVSGEQKEALLAKADIYCLPSYKEGFPMGIIEAMSLEIPIVASRAGGIPDALEHGKEGLLIDAGDIQALANAITRLIQDRALNTELAANAKQKFTENFSTEVIFNQLDQIYAEVLSE